MRSTSLGAIRISHNPYLPSKVITTSRFLAATDLIIMLAHFSVDIAPFSLIEILLVGFQVRRDLQYKAFKY
jgi:hypothetical protein